MTTFTVDGKQVRVSVQPSQRARKTLEVKFISSDELVVKYPYNKEVDVESLLQKHRASIERSYKHYLSQKRILDGDLLLVGGVPHKMVLNNIWEPPAERVLVHDGTLTINVRGAEDPAILLRDWVKGQTRKLVDDVTEKHRDELGGPSRIFVTETTRWGYCRKNGEVIINWQLACLTTRLAEFVILHELVHLRVLNHQREFHSKMLKLMPDYIARESELRYYLPIESDALNNILRSRTE
jgi:predicted metal-dependent hydrolase